jgi:hypothetical protein
MPLNCVLVFSQWCGIVRLLMSSNTSHSLRITADVVDSSFETSLPID